MACPPRLLLAFLVAAPMIGAGGPIGAAFADEEPAAVPADLFEQTDRKKTITIKLPRSWKQMGGQEVDPKALATFRGFFGEEKQSPEGAVMLYIENQFGRAALARATDLPNVGKVKAPSLRQGPGWAEGCAVEEREHLAVWRRYVEKGLRVYMVQFVAADASYDTVHGSVEKLLDTTTVPGEYAPPSMGAGWTSKKIGEFDVLTDVAPDRESSLKKATALLADARDVMEKALPGKPFDVSRPAAWIFQNGSKYDDRVKAVLGVEQNFASFNPVDRCAMVSILGESAQGHEEAVYVAEAGQYVWQYFGGAPPLWVDIGLRKFGQLSTLSGGKGKLLPAAVTGPKAAVAVGKRRLDQWFDVVRTNEITDNAQGANELFAWHWYFRYGRGARKYKKQYDGYIAALRETGDPASARKAFEGVNFEEMLKDFKDWAVEWK